MDDDYSTVVVITNIGNQPARFQVEIRYAGGPYSVKQRELAVGETATFDMRQMRDEQKPDRVGKTLPRDLDRGQFHWSLVATPGEAHIIGRAEVVSRSARVTSSYSCPVCCPDSGPSGGFDPNAYGLFVDNFAFTNARGDYYDCYGNFYSGTLGWNSMWTNNTSIATINASTQQLHGMGAGETAVEGNYQYVDWFSDGMDCYQSYGSGSDSAPVDVAPHIDSISPAASAVGHPVTATLSGKGFASGASISPGSGVTVSEITVSSSTSMSATFSVAANATAGNRDVTVTVNGMTSNSRTFAVQVPDRLRVVSNTGNLPVAACPSVMGRQITYQIADSSASHSAIQQAVSVAEALDSLTTNTCGNGQPSPSSCAPADDSGQFTDGISVNPSCGGGALSACSSNASCGYEYTQRWLTCYPEAVIELASMPGITHCNEIRIDNSTHLSIGTLLPK
jgi:hypothetical protein